MARERVSRNMIMGQGRREGPRKRRATKVNASRERLSSAGKMGTFQYSSFKLAANLKLLQACGCVTTIIYPEPKVFTSHRALGYLHRSGRCLDGWRGGRSPCSCRTQGQPSAAERSSSLRRVELVLELASLLLY